MGLIRHLMQLVGNAGRTYQLTLRGAEGAEAAGGEVRRVLRKPSSFSCQVPWQLLLVSDALALRHFMETKNLSKKEVINGLSLSKLSEEFLGKPLNKDWI